MGLDAVRQSLSEVIAITLTPFDSSGAVDTAAYERIVSRMIDGGVRTLTVNGNTSEFYTLSPAEADLGLTVTTRTAGPGTTVIAGVGFDVETAVTAAKRAGDAGAQAVMVHQPVHPYVSNQGWVEYHRLIAKQVPDLAVIPYVRNERIGASDFISLAEQCENVIGVKYAVADVVRFATISREVGDRVVWIDGLAELLAPAYFSIGATGFTSGLVNVAPHLSLQLLDGLRGGDRSDSMSVWDTIREFEDMRVTRGGADNVSVIKEALYQLGLCNPEVRAPSSRLTEADRLRVKHVLTSWGVDR